MHATDIDAHEYTYSKANLTTFSLPYCSANKCAFIGTFVGAIRCAYIVTKWTTQFVSYWRTELTAYTALQTYVLYSITKRCIMAFIQVKRIATQYITILWPHCIVHIDQKNDNDFVQ